MESLPRRDPGPSYGGVWGLKSLGFEGPRVVWSVWVHADYRCSMSVVDGLGRVMCHVENRYERTRWSGGPGDAAGERRSGDFSWSEGAQHDPS